MNTNARRRVQVGHAEHLRHPHHADDGASPGTEDVGVDYDPRRHLLALGYTIVVSILPGDMVAVTDYAAKTVTVDPRLLPGETRATLAHEVAHVIRGPGYQKAAARRNTGGIEFAECANEERLCDEYAARRCVRVDELERAAGACGSFDDLAGALLVDWEILVVWFEVATPEERERAVTSTSHLSTCRPEWLDRGLALLDTARLHRILGRR